MKNEETFSTLMAAAAGPQYCRGAAKVVAKLGKYVTKAWEVGNRWGIGVEIYGKQYVLRAGTYTAGKQKEDLHHLWLESEGGHHIYNNICIYIDAGGRVEYRTFDMLGIAAGALDEGDVNEEPWRLGRKLDQV